MQPKPSSVHLVKIAFNTAVVTLVVCLVVLPFIDPPEDHGVLSAGERVMVREMGFGYIESIDGDVVTVRLESGSIIEADTFDVADVYDDRHPSLR